MPTAAMTPADRDAVEAVTFGLLLRGGNPTWEFIGWLNEHGKAGEERSACWLIYYAVCKHFPGGAIDDQSRTVKTRSVLS